MTLQEAIKSGKHFRRTSWDSFLPWCHIFDDPSDGCEKVAFIDGEGFIPIIEDLISDDWELKPDEPTFLIAYAQKNPKAEPREYSHFLGWTPRSFMDEWSRLIDERLVDHVFKALENAHESLTTGNDRALSREEAEQALALYRRHVPEKR